MTKPVIIYISGAPGSGKTTLAKILSEQLSLPRLSNDIVHSSVSLLEPAREREKTLKETFVPLMIDMSKRKISFIVDHVLQKDISKNDVIDKLLPYSNIVIIHLKTKDPIKRYTDRVQNSDIPSVISRREHLLKRAQHHAANLDNTQNPIDLGLPTIVVNTDNGYDPSLDNIVGFIKDKLGI